jgi:hypothetical protein
VKGYCKRYRDQSTALQIPRNTERLARHETGDRKYKDMDLLGVVARLLREQQRHKPKIRAEAGNVSLDEYCRLVVEKEEAAFVDGSQHIRD